MSVSARPANDLPLEANVELVDLRAATPVRAGTFPYEGPDLDHGFWHSHPVHQIEYAFEGIAEVETADGHYLLPPQQAIWIPAGLPHSTTLKGVRSNAVFFDPSMFPAVDGRARVIAAAPVLREMMAYATRWPIERPSSDPTADAFFDALALMVAEMLEHEAPLCLPTSSDPVIRAAMAATQATLAEATSQSVARSVGVSERTLRRQFRAETDMTWRAYLLASRMMRSMALLTEPNRTVLDVATEVGFDSVSAFTRAFGRFAGETPSAYRARVRRTEP